MINILEYLFPYAREVLLSSKSILNIYQIHTQ